MEKIKIFLVDDHQIMLDGIRSLLKNDKQVEIVGEATRCSQALEQIPVVRPDIIITDIHMPEMNGIVFTKEIRLRFPEIKVVALSMSGEETMIHDMLDAGISGYVIKNTGKEELKEALIEIHKGNVYFSAEISAILAKGVMTKRKEQQEPDRPKLTQREIEIVQLIAKEYSNEKIAKTLFISERTVETHRKNIFRKTDTKSVIGLLKYAMEKKLL